jgi:hypothetical protein
MITDSRATDQCCQAASCSSTKTGGNLPSTSWTFCSAPYARLAMCQSAFASRSSRREQHCPAGRNAVGHGSVGTGHPQRHRQGAGCSGKCSVCTYVRTHVCVCVYRGCALCVHIHPYTQCMHVCTLFVDVSYVCMYVPTHKHTCPHAGYHAMQSLSGIITSLEP